MEDQLQQVVIETFSMVREKLSLGVRDLLDALMAVEVYMPSVNSGDIQHHDSDPLLYVLMKLWCDETRTQQVNFVRVELERMRLIIQQSVEDLSIPLGEDDATPAIDWTDIPTLDFQQGEDTPEPPLPPAQPIEESAPLPEPDMSVVPISPHQPPRSDTILHSYTPITARMMSYQWRFLKRTVRDGARSEFDLNATIHQTIHHGMFIGPAYRRKERNTAHLVLLLDQMGSMMPFHRYLRDLVMTAKDDPRLEQVDVYYFQNVPLHHVYLDEHLTKPKDLNEVFTQLNHHICVLIVSDAGAGRGAFNPLRVRQTTRFIQQVREYTSLITWVNPMPQSRWAGSSASLIASFIPMFPMSEDGFAYAIETLRGLNTQYD